MKKILFVLLCIVSATTAFAQKGLLTLDEHNKYIYYQVVETPGITADSLFSRITNGFKQYYHKQNIKPVTDGKTSVDVKAVLIVYSNNSLAKHEDGEFSYTLHADFKDFKYRYWVTDLVYNPYKKNRYGTFEKAPGIEIPIEQAKGKIDDKFMDSYKEQIVSFSKQTGENIKIYTEDPQKALQQPTKVDTKKW